MTGLVVVSSWVIRRTKWRMSANQVWRGDCVRSCYCHCNHVGFISEFDGNDTSFVFKVLPVDPFFWARRYGLLLGLHDVVSARLELTKVGWKRFAYPELFAMAARRFRFPSSVGSVGTQNKVCDFRSQSISQSQVVQPTRWLCTRGLSEPTFRPSRAWKRWKKHSV